ncbi:endonuclease/exonuclease/phosphatase family protein [Aegicerativicinus sediminis]|uniref:endonuclease/exonuclease/phosphatase family protein n=1 Tax=Aegicerativicinus sediminis TaxID=2893202 RepID=UPI001E2F6A8E|nr:endonuclease/exonuclease/phosphatase family protein [Aegicerativicinus sediminis]
MTYNIRYDSKDKVGWEVRKSFLIAQLNFFEPDIIGTQEGLIHQLNDIENGLSNYSFFGKGRDHGDKRGEHSAIFYNNQNLKLLKSETFWLSETPDKPSKGWDAAIKRVCTSGFFEKLHNKKKFYVFNLHLDHVGEQARINSVKLVLQKIIALTKENHPVVLMGDFNLEPAHSAINSIKSALRDTYELAGENVFGPEGTFNGFKIDYGEERRIDYIFVSEDFKVQKLAILSEVTNAQFPSDHFPVLALLQFEQ